MRLASEKYVLSYFPDNFSVNYPKVQEQKDGSSCGLFVIAFVKELYDGLHPDLLKFLKFKVSKMRDHLRECLEKRSVLPFPKFTNN